MPSVLFATSEVAPLVKTGGLADVSASLPAALAGLGLDVRLLLPGYPAIVRGVRERCRVGRIVAHAGLPGATLLSGRIGSGLRCYVIDCPELYGRAGNPYTDSGGADWTDNPIRFGLLSWVAALLGGAGAAPGAIGVRRTGSTASPIAWQPDIVHCNDWQTGLAPAYLAFGTGTAVGTGTGAGAAAALATPVPAASVFTVHNLAFAGNFAPTLLARLGLPVESFGIDGLEYYGQLSFLKAGLYYANQLTTVSPTYAREIQDEPLGFGFQGLLAARADRLSGILNGIDEAGWNPATDPLLVTHFDSATLAARADNRHAVQKRMGLTPDAGAMLLGVVSRFTEQKGIDLILDAWPQLMNRGHRLQLAMLGSGERALTQRAADLVHLFPGGVAFQDGFDEPLSHPIEGGVDAFLMPSRFEPCGLNQMYSQRYGAPPIVRATGGLADSVVDADVANVDNDTDADAETAGAGSGFLFMPDTAAALIGAVERALAAWRDPQRWQSIQRAGMARDFGWQSSARQYLAVYRRALAARSAAQGTPAPAATTRSSSPSRTGE